MLKVKVLTITPEGREKDIAVLMEKRVNEVIEKEKLEVVDIKSPTEISVSGYKAVVVVVTYKEEEKRKGKEEK